MSNELATTNEKEVVEFIPFGAVDSIKLNLAIVQNMIAVPTRTGKTPSRNDALKFMMLCRARRLNPFEGDAFLLGYDTQNGPQFSLITAHQVFLKRAEAADQFDGMESGVILKGKADGEIIEREGDFLLKDETLLGGWARVYVKNRSKPTYRRLNLSVFSTGRSRWEKDPAGMIVKCAEADALRSTFPTHLGGLYMHEEKPVHEIAAEVIDPNQPGKPKFDPLEDKKEEPPKRGRPRITEKLREPVETEDDKKAAQLPPEEDPAPGAEQAPPVLASKASPVEQLRNLLKGSNVTEAEFFRYCDSKGFGRFNTLDELSVKRIENVVADWADILNDIQST